MKSLPLLAAAFAVLAFAAPQAHAKPVGKLKGTYKGMGTFVDKRTAPTLYTYTFNDIVVVVAVNGKFTGSADVSATYTLAGMVIPYPGTTHVTVGGKATSVKVAKGKLTAMGQLTFSNGTMVDGMFSVKAKTGKGSFTAKDSDAQFDVNFTLRK